MRIQQIQPDIACILMYPRAEYTAVLWEHGALQTRWRQSAALGWEDTPVSWLFENVTF